MNITNIYITSHTLLIIDVMKFNYKRNNIWNKRLFERLNIKSLAIAKLEGINV